MILIKNGIAKTIPESKAGAYKAAGWVEIVQKAAEEKPKKTRAKKEA